MAVLATHRQRMTTTQQAQPRAVVLGPHGGARWAADYAAGLVETELPYGAECLRGHGLTVTYPALEDGRFWSTRAARAVTRRLHDAASLPVTPALGTAPQWLTADVVVSFFEDNGFAMYPLLEARRRLSDRPFTSIVVACWLAEKAVSASFHVIRRYARMLRAFDHVVCFSSNQAGLLHKRLDIPEQKIITTTFGCCTAFFAGTELASPEHKLVVAVGNDVGRDYGTFVTAVDESATEALIVTNSWHAERLPGSERVQVRQNVNRHAYREVLATAAVVVVPTFALAYPTGQSVLIEAMAAGRACVVTRSASIRDYAHDGRNALLVPPGDARALADAIRFLLERPDERRRLGEQARSDAQSRHDIEHMWGGIASALQWPA